MAGNCYESALKKWVSLTNEGVNNIKIAHGIVTGQSGYVKDKKFGHAWLEINDYCLDTEKDGLLAKEKYYELGKIDPQDVFLYDKTAISVWIDKNGTCGPWELEETEFEMEVSDGRVSN